MKGSSGLGCAPSEFGRAIDQGVHAGSKARPTRCLLALLLLFGLLAAIGPISSPIAAATGVEQQDAVAFQMTPGHSGSSTDPTGPDWTVAWADNVAGPLSYPLIASGEVFALSDSASPTLYAFSASTGAIIWQDSVGGTPLGITYDDGQVFEQSGDLLSAFAASNGALNWSAAIPYQYYFTSAPSAENGIVFTDGAGGGGTMYAFAESSGDLLWTASVENGDNSSPAVGPNGVYGSYACNLTQAFNPTTGSGLWTYEDGCEGGGGQTAVLADGDLFLRDLVLNAATGAVVSSLDAGLAPAVDADNVYLENDGTLRAQTVTNGSVLWSFAGDGGLDTSPIVDNGVVYEGSSSGKLYGLSAVTGQVLWSTSVGSAITPAGTETDSFSGLGEGDKLLAVPSENKLTVFHEIAPPPSAPGAVDSNDSGGSQAVLTWTVPANNGSPIDSFTITRSYGGSAQTPVVIPAGSVGSSTDPTPGANDQYTVTGLKNNTPVLFTVSADNAGGPGPSTAAEQAPAFGSSDATLCDQGVSSSFTVSSSGFPAPSLLESGSLPAGMTFVDNGDGTGTLSGTPAVGSFGTYPITFTASNGVGSPATQSFTLTIGEAPVITSPAATTFAVGSPGSFITTASGFPAVNFSETGPLPAGVSFTTEGTLSGTPAEGTAGTYPITVSAENGVPGGRVQPFVLTVDGPPAITSSNAATLAQGSEGSFTVRSSGFPASSLAESGTLPTGLDFVDNGDGTGTLSGTPAVGTFGAYPITFIASNGIGTPATQNFTLTIGEAPVITSVSATTFTVGSPGSFTMTATGYPGATFTETGLLPTGVRFTTQGTLSGTPAAGTAGTYSITVTADNGVTGGSVQVFVLTVDGQPSITSVDATTIAQGSEATFTVIATGVPAPSLAESGTLPMGMRFVDNGNGTGALSGTPTVGSFGTYPITFTASNGIGTAATQNFTLTIGEAPVITSGVTATFAVGAPGSFMLAATAFPAANFSETGLLPSGVTLTTEGLLSGAPTVGTAGTYPITIVASNGVVSSATQHFVLSIVGPPTITTPSATTIAQGSAGEFGVTATGVPTPSLAEAGTLPMGMSFVDNGNGTGTLSGTPAVGTFGTYWITLRATNGVGAPTTQSFKLTIGEAPAITSAGTLTFEKGVSGSFTPVATGYPTPATRESGALPSGVKFTGGELSGSPTVTGTYPITFTATNDVGAAATQDFTLTIGEAPVITSAAGATFTKGVRGSFTPAATGYPTPAITESGVLPTGVTFTGGVLSGTPTVTGTYRIGFKGENGVGGDATQAFVLTVLGFHISSTTVPSLVRGVSYRFQLSTLGGKAPYLWKTSSELPSGLKLSASGLLSGTVPKTVAAGSRTIKASVTDASLPSHQSASASVVLRMT